MAKSKAQMMVALYHNRKAAGLVPFKGWTTPDKKTIIQDFANSDARTLSEYAEIIKSCQVAKKE